MSYQEIFFDTSGTITFNDYKVLNNNTYVCNYYPNEYETLKMKIQNVSFSYESFIKFKIIFNNQYPRVDVSKNYISEVILNNEIAPIKFNDNNSNAVVDKSHYIIQEFIVKQEENESIIVLTKILKLQSDPSINMISNVDIVSIKKLADNSSYYDISYTNYYTNSGEPYIQDGYPDRKKIDVSFVIEQENDIAEFDNFIVNLYKSSGHLIDTSGNENDPSSNKISKTSNSFEIRNLNLEDTFYTKVYPVINNNYPDVNTSEYVFNFSNFFRLKELQIYTKNTTNSLNVKNNIKSIQYKYDLENTEYSEIKIEEGVKSLNTSQENTTIHNFQIATPNIYRCFKIAFNKDFNINNVENVKLIGDKRE